MTKLGKPDGLIISPDQIASIRKLHASAYSEDEIVKASRSADILSGVYFLIQQDKVVYVGQSNNVGARLASHLGSEKKFDKVTLLFCPVDVSLFLEALYIDKFQPIYNISPGRSMRERNAIKLAREEASKQDWVPPL